MIFCKTPFTLIDFNEIAAVKTLGLSGYSISRTMEKDSVRVRIVDYSKDFVADHWCSKGHVAFLLEGDMTIEIDDKRKFSLQVGNAFLIGDEIDAHRASSIIGAKLLIID